jgi:hypothetical protein
MKTNGTCILLYKTNAYSIKCNAHFFVAKVRKELKTCVCGEGGFGMGLSKKFTGPKYNPNKMILKLLDHSLFCKMNLVRKQNFKFRTPSRTEIQLSTII